ncbi:MAG: phosphatase PAP2 family protein [Propylenella sp.]
MNPVVPSSSKSAAARAGGSVWAERQSAAWFVVGVFATLLTMLVVDRPLASAVRDWPTLAAYVGAVTNDIKGFYLIALALLAALLSLLAFFLGPHRTRAAFREGAVAAGFVFAVTTIGLVAVTILKISIGRARPELFATYGPFAFSPFSTAKEMNSFPSGEATMATAFFGALACMAWDRLGRAWAAVVILPAVLIAVSRVIVGAHYASDVLAAIVLALSLLAWLYPRAIERHAAIAGALDRQRARLRKAPSDSARA